MQKYLIQDGISTRTAQKNEAAMMHVKTVQ